MKVTFYSLIIPVLFPIAPLLAQEAPRPANAGSSHDYLADIRVVHDAQQQALEQARQMLEKVDGDRERLALETAIKEMERAEAALEAARKSPEKLPAAIAAEQSAYQALLKTSSRERRMTRSRNGNQQNGGAVQAGQREMDQLDMQREENRYETERQATASQTAKQREQVQTADRLKELSQRQQDLNERLRELQTALQAARTEQERTEVQRQLKRLQDEQRQMLAKVDEMRQKLDQSPNANSQAETRQQLEQTRSDMERAAQEMERQSASDALAAGTRAQERMQNLRDDLRKQTSSQFAEQMKQLRNQARDLKQQEDEIGRELDSLSNGERQSLDNSAERRQIVKQMEKQQSTLTNMLSGMRTVTEQAETTEPLLSKQLYDTLRRSDQMRTENLLQLGSQLTERGFLPQANQAEQAARTNIAELARSVERAAESVLGSEADALRYAQKELDDLSRQVEREMAAADTNSASTSATGNSPSRGQSNNLSNAASGSPAREQSQSGENAARGNQTAGGNREQASAGDAQNGQRQGERRRDSDQADRGGESGGGGADYGPDRLRDLTRQLGAASDSSGPIMGDDYVNWTDRLRGVEEAVDPTDLRNQLATVRERASALRSEYRTHGRKPDTNVVRQQILAPLTQVRVWLQEELARKEKSDSLVPLDRDPVPDSYAELVRKYYEKLGSAQ